MTFRLNVSYKFFWGIKIYDIHYTHTHRYIYIDIYIYIYIYVYNIWLIHQWVSILEYERFEPKSLIWQLKALFIELIGTCSNHMIEMVDNLNLENGLG